VIYHYLPIALSLPTKAQWEQLKEAAFSKRQENESQSFFHIITDSISTGIMVVDRNLKIVMANLASSAAFQMPNKELIGRQISDLIPSSVKHHNVLMNQFFELSTDYQYPMAKGRAVKAVAGNGEEIEVEIKLSQFKYFEQSMVAVTVENKKSIHNPNNSDRLERTLRCLASVMDGAWEWNIKTDEVWWNSQHAKLIGVNPTEPPSFRLWEQHLHPDIRENVLKEISLTIANGQDFDLDYLGRTENGSYQWFRTRGKIYYENGEPAIMSGMLSNINHTRELQSELNEKTNFLNRLIDRSVAGVYVFDLAKKQNTYINNTYSRILGYSPSDIEQIEDLTTLFHADDLVRISKHIDEVTASPESIHEIVYRFKHKEGHWVWCLSQDSANDIDGNGRVTSMLGTFINITDLKEKEQTIQDWAASFYSIFNQAAVGIAQVSLEGSFIRVNRKLCEMWGYSESDLLQKTFQELTYSDDLDRDLENVNKLIEGEGESYSIEKRYICSDGHIQWTLLTVKIVRDSDDKPQHFIAVIEDIGERKKTEEALNESNKALEMFAFTASHDLQEPLRKIKTFSSLIEERLSGKWEDPDARYELNRISDAANRMSYMITSILDLSRASNVELQRKPVMLSAIVDNALETMSVHNRPETLNVTVKTDVICFVDVEQMSRVLVNLFSNSIKYQLKNINTIVTLQGHIEGNYTIISIVDNGPGIASSDTESVFAPFKRLVGRDISGSGMGLSICRQIVKRHHGSILIRDTNTEGLYLEIRIPNEDGNK
jgi:PAS domain S-box-containing protein